MYWGCSPEISPLNAATPTINVPLENGDGTSESLWDKFLAERCGCVVSHRCWVIEIRGLLHFFWKGMKLQETRSVGLGAFWFQSIWGIPQMFPQIGAFGMNLIFNLNSNFKLEVIQWWFVSCWPWCLPMSLQMARMNAGYIIGIDLYNLLEKMAGCMQYVLHIQVTVSICNILQIDITYLQMKKVMIWGNDMGMSLNIEPPKIIEGNDSWLSDAIGIFWGGV